MMICGISYHPPNEHRCPTNHQISAEVVFQTPELGMVINATASRYSRRGAH
jgi:uncharacterized OB-fold protein